jgi:hypothetical protein
MRSCVVLWVDPYSRAVSEDWTQGARKLIVPRAMWETANERASRLLGIPKVNPFAQTIDASEVHLG